MKRNIITSTFILFALNGTSQLKYPLPDAKLTAKQICGKNVCNPGNVGKLLHYTLSPFSPAVKKATTVEEVAIQVLGQTLPLSKMLTSKDFSTCSNMSDNPFTSADIENVRFLDGRDIEYERKETLDIDFSSAVNANVKELMKLTTDVAKIEKLKITLGAKYSKLKGKELSIVGKYSEWELSKETREKLKKGDGFQECRKLIEKDTLRILLAVGIVYFEIKSDENSLDELATEIDAELAKEGIEGSLSFTFKKEVTKKFKTSGEVYQILIVRHAGLKNNQFVETF